MVVMLTRQLGHPQHLEDTGSAAARGARWGALGEVPGLGPHVWASESSSRPPFPSRYLARSFLVTSPTTCENKVRSWEPSGLCHYCGMWGRTAQFGGDLEVATWPIWVLALTVPCRS